MLTFYCKETSHVFLGRPGIIHTHVQIHRSHSTVIRFRELRVLLWADFFSPDEIRSDNLFLVRPPRFPAAFPELRVLREENLIKQNVYIYIHTKAGGRLQCTYMVPAIPDVPSGRPRTGECVRHCCISRARLM